MAYIGNNPEVDAGINKYEYQATAGQTTFNCTYDTKVDVFLNGVLLSVDDYTATSGTSIILNTGASLDDIVQIDAYQSIINNSGTNNTDYGLYEHAHTITGNYSIQTGNNALSGGPITVGTGASVTVPSGSTWTVA